MSAPRAFISFDFDHDQWARTLMRGQSKNERIPFQIEDWSSKAPLQQSNWIPEMEKKIKKTHMVIVMIGRYMPSADGVHTEIRIAKRLGIPCFAVYAKKEYSNLSLPSVFDRMKKVHWADIPEAVEWAMRNQP